MFNQEKNITKLVGKESPIKIETENIEIFKLFVEENYSLKLEQSSYYSIYLINGEAKINNVVIEKDDFIKIYDQEMLEINSKKKSDFFIVKSPRRVSYTTYI